MPLGSLTEAEALLAEQVGEAPPPLPWQTQVMALPDAGKLLFGLKLVAVPAAQKVSLPKVVAPEGYVLLAVPQEPFTTPLQIFGPLQVLVKPPKVQVSGLVQASPSLQAVPLVLGAAGLQLPFEPQRPGSLH